MDILNQLCRVCTNRAQTKREKTSKKQLIKAIDVMDEIHILYGIDVSQDISSIHPVNICSECNYKIVNSKHTGIIGPNVAEMNLDGKYADQKTLMEDKDIWKEHVEGECTICIAIYGTIQTKAGIQQKDKKREAPMSR